MRVVEAKLLYTESQKGLTEKVLFEKRSEGNEKESHAYNIVDKRKSKQSCDLF